MITTVLACVAILGSAAAQGATAAIAPQGSTPDGFQVSYPGKFQLAVVNTTLSKRSYFQQRAACSNDNMLVASLANGTLTDAKGRTGYIASNHQLQFDGPPQSGSLYTSGFAVSRDGLLNLGNSSVFYQCKSGDFYNLYDTNDAPQCSRVAIAVLPCGGNNLPAPSAGPLPICQIGDGQIQAHTTSCIQPSAATTAAAGPVGPTGIPVVQSSEGQVGVTNTAPPAPKPTTPAGGSDVVSTLVTAPSQTPRPGTMTSSGGAVGATTTAVAGGAVTEATNFALFAAVGLLYLIV